MFNPYIIIFLDRFNSWDIFNISFIMEEEYEMVKSFFSGVLVTLIVCGITFFSYGRISTANVSRAIERTDRDLERVESNLSDFGSNFDKYAGKVAILSTESGGLWEQAEDLRDRSSEHVREYEGIQSELQYFGDGIDHIEKSVRRSVVVSRDFADILYEYRRRSKIDAEEK